MQTAPVSPREPPTTSTWPELNLVELGSAPRRELEDARGRSAPPAGSAGRAVGDPDLGAPAARRCAPCPGAIQWPSLAAWKLTVTSASTAAPSTSPVEASTPEAMSAATTGRPAGVDRLDRARRRAPRGAPLKPVPKIASTTTPRRVERRGQLAGATSRTVAVEALEVRRARRSDSSPPATAAAPRPRSRSSPDGRAATSPSPPLLPLPQTTRAGPSARDLARRLGHRARRPPPSAPARARRCSSIAQASAARIASASCSGSAQLQPSIGASVLAAGRLVRVDAEHEPRGRVIARRPTHQPSGVTGGRSLDRDRLGEVARLVDVEAVAARAMW